MARRQSTEALYEALEEAALAGAQEIREFLTTYRGKDPDRLRRVYVLGVWYFACECGYRTPMLERRPGDKAPPNQKVTHGPTPVD